MPDSTITLRTRAELGGVTQTIDALRQASIAAGQSEAKFLELAGALSRQALAAGDVVRAEQLLAAAMGQSNTQAQVGTRLSLQQAQAEARLQAALGNRSGAARAIADELGRQEQRTIAVINAERQLAQVSSGGVGAQFAQGLQSGLLGIVGPAALATAAIGTVKGAVDSFTEAFKFKAELDQNTASITAQLRGVRDSSQAFAEARVFAERYKLTQEETTTAIQASVPLLRQSKSSLTDVLTVLAKLQVLKPEQGIQGAAFALAELQGGQTRSLATRFNIPIAKANELKKEIQAGGDAVQVLGDYLTKAGIGAEALAVGTKGAAGALRDVARAQEDLKIAQADFAAGPGTKVIQTQTTLLTGLSRLLKGELVTGIQAATTNWVAASAAQLAYGNALNSGKTQTEAQAAAQAAYNDSLNHSAQTTDNAARAQNAYASARQHGATQAQAQAAAEATVTGVVDRNAVAYTTAATAAQYYADATQHAAEQGIASAQAQQQQLALTGGAYNAYVQAATAAYAPVVQGAQAAQASAEASVADAAAKDLQQAKTALVSDQTNKAATSFIALHPAMTATEAYAVAVAEGLGELVAKVIAFRIEANKAKADLVGPTSVDKGEREYSTSAELAGVAAESAAGKAAALRNQILLTGGATAVVAQRQKDYNEAVKRYGANSKQAIDAQTDLIQAQQALDRANKPKRAGAPGGKGLGALDRVDISLAGDYQAQLNAVNAKLAKGHLTELQRKQLQKERLDLEKKIADEQDRAHKAALDARISEIEDRKQRREEAKRLSAANAVLAHPELFNEEQRANAADLVELIPLQQQKRTDEIDAKRRVAGSNAALAPAPSNTPPPGAAQQPAAAPQAPSPVGTGGTPLILQMDSKQVGSILLPFIIDGLRSSAFQVRAAGG